MHSGSHATNGWHLAQVYAIAIYVERDKAQAELRQMAQQGQLGDRGVDAMCRWMTSAWPMLNPSLQSGSRGFAEPLAPSPGCRALFNGTFTKLADIEMLRSVSPSMFKVSRQAGSEASGTPLCARSSSVPGC